MPENPSYDQDGFRARTSVKDPTGVNTAFDAGDAAEDTDWSQNVDELIRVRLVVRQTNGAADVTGDLATEFLLQYRTNSGTWTDVGAVGGDVEDVQYIASSGFADHDNTTELLTTFGTFATGDGLETNVATDTITFATASTGKTEIEVSVEIVGANVNNDDTIELRVLYSNGDESPPATILDNYTDMPVMTVVKTVPITGTSAFDIPALTTTAAGVVGHTGTSAFAIPALTTTAAGIVGHPGTSAFTIPPLTTTASGTVGHPGTSAFVIPPLTTFAEGTVSGGPAAITGTSAFTIPPLTTTAAGVVGHPGTSERRPPAP
jgi:hypothetical protein